MAWNITESHKVKKELKKLAPELLRRYDGWKSIILEKGLEAAHEIHGLHDKHLHGGLARERSVRLNHHFRVIYHVDREHGEIFVENISPHDYTVKR